VSAPLPALVADAPTVAVVGLGKNAGKTTVVNHLLEHLDGRLGLASLGLDGEETDHLTGLPKPRVRPPAGALVATAERLLNGAAPPVVARLPFRTAVGEIVVVRAAGGRPVAVCGPARLDQLDATVAALRAAGARRVILEGALGRLGIARSERVNAVVLAAGAALAAGRDGFARAVALALDALDLPVDAHLAPDLLPVRGAGYEEEVAAAVARAGAGVVELPGALTGPLLERLIRAGARTCLVVADATRVLARPQQVAHARRAGVAVVARRPLPIRGVTSSPFHPDFAVSADEAFAAVHAAARGRWPVVDVVTGRSA
jgi:hypothetical protein